TMTAAQLTGLTGITSTAANITLADAVTAAVLDGVVVTGDTTFTLANAANTITLGANTIAAGTVTLTFDGSASASALAFTGTTEADALLVVTGGSAADTIVGNAVANTITGGAGADTITASTGANVVFIGNTDSGIANAAACDTITDFTAATYALDLGVAGDATANTGNYVEVADADYAGNFTNILSALNAAAATLAGTSSAAEIYVFAADTQAAASGTGASGYIGDDIDGNGVIDQVIVLSGIATNTAISAADFV
ncbi:MAG: hypothetical protein PHC99_00770, partial [Methylococcales bacterium]|nr:hypothetical protein [Methylococcales bacterium]